MPKSPKKIVSKAVSSMPPADARRPSTQVPPADVRRPPAEIRRPPAPVQPASRTAPPAVVERKPMRESAKKAMVAIADANKAYNSETDDDDSVWSVTEEGVDDELCEKLYSFFQHQYQVDNVNKPIYKYLMRVMDDKEDFDEDHPCIKQLGTLLPTLNSKFSVFNREEYDDGTNHVFDMRQLLRHVEAGMGDDYEEDGWLVNDL